MFVVALLPFWLLSLTKQEKKLFDDLFADFSLKSTGKVFRAPENLSPLSLENFSDGVEAALLGCQRNHLNSGRFARIFSPRPTLRKLRPSLQKYCADILREDFAGYVDSKLDIAPADSVLRNGRSPYFIKVNHGFWEQVLAAGWPRRPKNIGRPVSPKHYNRIYFDTCFVDALLNSMRDSAKITNGTLAFEPIDFGVSLNNGLLSHREILDNFAELTDEDRVVGRGAMVGMLSFLECGFGASAGSFIDGGFAKRSFLSGELASWAETVPNNFDHVVYVVPPHLGKITLLDEGKIAQTVYQISGRKLLLSWLPTLYLLARGIYEKLETGEKLVVVTQSAVFSALLGCFVHQIARTFDKATPPVSFLDLGQVLDMANPDAAASWVKVYQPDQSLSPFRMRG